MLLDNDGYYLKLASQLQENGILFGLDENDTLMIADGGETPVMKGEGYGKIRKAVLRQGYEMFPHRNEQYSCPFPRYNDGGRLIDRGGWSKSLEIAKFEAFTGKPFLGNYDDGKWLESWLESGDWEDGDINFKNPVTGEYKGSRFDRTEQWNLPRHFVHDHHGRNYITFRAPGIVVSSGVRRLLRLKK